jgi:hypothetical protein
MTYGGQSTVFFGRSLACSELVCILGSSAWSKPMIITPTMTYRGFDFWVEGVPGDYTYIITSGDRLITSTRAFTSIVAAATTARDRINRVADMLGWEYGPENAIKAIQKAHSHI